MAFFSFLSVFCFSQGMKAFDTGTPTLQWVGYLSGIAQSQLMPAAWIIAKAGIPISKYFQGLAGYLLFYMNSLFLVGVYWCAIRAIRRRTGTPRQAL
jgi:hypothetical protein